MTRLIDTAEATAIIADYFDEICDTEITFNESEILRRLNKKASEQPTIDAEPEQKWIPVTERLPEETGLYLISIKTKGVEALEKIYPDGLVYVSAYDAVIMHWGYGGKNVQAWQPLPEPYQEEKNGGRTGKSD